MIEFMFLKELTLIEQMHQKSVMFVTISIFFFNYSFKFQPNVFNRCHDLLIIPVNLSDIAILNIRCSDYCCINSLIRKYETKNECI